MRRIRSIIISVIMLIGLIQFAYSQCASVISNYPFSQSFETSDGGWVRSSSDHWQWGIVSGKQVISSAANGIKSWVAGGLSGSNYNTGISYIQSPCFDFSSLANPEVEFNVFWETEQRYDGANLQYSTDGGISWSVLGTSYSNANCLAVNWYNESNILKLNNQTGWSGSVMGGCSIGNGSGDWVLAKHSLSMLSGKPKVIFRFYFGAGNVCNEYDGFAIDDFTIREAPPKGANFNFTCQANSKVNFINNSSVCAISYAWNFGDPASGINNASALANPSHIFSAPGSYTVNLDVIFSDGSVSSTDQQIIIITVNPVITNQISCNGDKNGSIATNVLGGNGIYNYSWNTIPPQTSSSLNGLNGGTYTVTVTSLHSCPASSSVTLVEPEPVKVESKIKPETCESKNGSIEVKVTGGTCAFTYLWSNN
ncbi:MAG: PKD domain-containing protein [Ferruginibacter sp.]|nr:PKD domain-containing protein [Ferruginibacter sp.]